MDPITQQTVLAAAGAAGGDKVYVDDVFSTFLYEGTGAAKTIPNGIDLDGEGGLVWIKQRDESRNPSLYDTERGVLRQLYSNLTNGQAGASGNDLDGFNSNGFSLGTDTFSYVNKSGGDYVSWTFRKAPGFFDVVTYTGNNTAGRTVAHNLGSVPGMILVKCVDTNEHWHVYHRSVGATKYLILNSSNPENSGSTVWNNTTPTSTHFTVSTNPATNGTDSNGNGLDYVAYIFAHDDAQYGTDGDESIIKCGTYNGTGSAGNFINLGFEPQWVMIKRKNDSGNWMMFDMMRGIPTGDIDSYLLANDAQAEVGPGDSYQAEYLSVNPTGFTLETNAGDTNGSGKTFVYMAIRRPNKPPEAATEVFAIDTYTGSIPNYISGFPVDFVINRDGINSGGDVTVFSRLLGTKRLKTNSSEAEGNAFVAAEMDYSNGYASGTGTSPDSEKYSWMFKRAPGFMDVVTYTGNSVAGRQIPHNLGSTPGMIIVKVRNGTDNWTVQLSSEGGTKSLYLNQSGGLDTSSSEWNNTTAGSSVFTVGTSGKTNNNYDTYIAYLFATLPGISKVGSYTSDGNAVDIDCGFTNGARFILIKNLGTGNWNVWDSTRGIVSGNDPYLRLNRDNNGTDAQVTNTDYIDPESSGFSVTANNYINYSGETYIFLAIA